MAHPLATPSGASSAAVPLPLPPSNKIPTSRSTRWMCERLGETIGWRLEEEMEEKDGLGSWSLLSDGAKDG